MLIFFPAAVLFLLLSWQLSRDPSVQSVFSRTTIATAMVASFPPGANLNWRNQRTLLSFSHENYTTAKCQCKTSLSIIKGLQCKPNNQPNPKPANFGLQNLKNNATFGVRKFHSWTQRGRGNKEHFKLEHYYIVLLLPSKRQREAQVQDHWCRGKSCNLLSSSVTKIVWL